MCYVVNSAPHSPAKMRSLKRRTTTLVCAINNDMIVYTCERGQVFYLFIYLSIYFIWAEVPQWDGAKPDTSSHLGSILTSAITDQEFSRTCNFHADVGLATPKQRRGVVGTTTAQFRFGAKFIAAAQFHQRGRCFPNLSCFPTLSQLKKLQPLASVGNLNCQVILQTAENSLDWSNSKFNALQCIVFTYHL